MNEPTTIKEQLLSGKTVASKTSGTSMKPLLYENKTVVFISPLDRELKLGDLPIFLRADGKYVIHRLVRIDGDYYYTRGDNCLGCEKVPKGEMLGVVTEILRKGKVIKVTDKGYRRYVRFWNAIFPLRKVYYKFRAWIKK